MSLTSILFVAPGDRKFSFVVDTASISVPITAPGAADNILTGEFNNVPASYFEVGETINILEVGVMCPHAFVFAEPFIINIIGQGDGEPSVILYESITIPALNVGYEINQNLSLEPVQNTGFGFVRSELIIDMQNFLGSVSMLNVPAVMQGETVELIPFLRLEHNFPLLDAP